MDAPTRTIYWNESAGGWYDVETDVWVKNLTAPTEEQLFNSRTPMGAERVKPVDPTAWVAKAIAEQYIDLTMNHIVPMAHEIKTLETRIVGLHERLWKIEHPWWKRW